jgi:hypothetical protein
MNFTCNLQQQMESDRIQSLEVVKIYSFLAKILHAPFVFFFCTASLHIIGGM